MTIFSFAPGRARGEVEGEGGKGHADDANARPPHAPGVSPGAGVIFPRLAGKPLFFGTFPGDVRGAAPPAPPGSGAVAGAIMKKIKRKANPCPNSNTSPLPITPGTPGAAVPRFRRAAQIVTCSATSGATAATRARSCGR